MMNETNIKKMEELLADAAFNAKVEAASSYEEIHQLLVDNDVDVSFDSFMEYNRDCSKVLNISQSEELDEEMLDSVAGGLWINPFGGKLVCIGLWMYKVIGGRLVRVTGPR